MHKVNSLLDKCKSKFILYTYDAFCLIFTSQKNLMLDVREKMVSGNLYPVRTYVGKSYDKMKEV